MNYFNIPSNLPNLSYLIIILIQLAMSAALPRIKTMNQLPPHPQLQAIQKLKFRKLALEPTQNGQQPKKSVRALKTERLKSLQRYSTTQQQRQYKNQKIHLNLIERKLLSGTYDEKKQTGNELNILKQKRDQIRVETSLKQREIERLKVQLEDVRKEIDQFLSKKGEHDIKLKEIKDKHQLQTEKTEAARQAKAVYQNMIKARHEINMVLCKRNNDLKQQLGYLNSALTLLNTEFREATEKSAIQETKFEELGQAIAIQRESRNNQIGKHQDKISKRKQGEVLLAQKSKQYVALLEQAERQSQSKDFKAIYNKILANLFVSKYFKKVMQDLIEKYQPYERSYDMLSSYKSFDSSCPSTLVTRYFQQQPQNAKNMHIIKQKEQRQLALQAKNQALKQKQMELWAQSMENSQHLQSITSQRDQTGATIKQNAEQIQVKIVRVKNSLLRIVKDLNQKGDRRLSNGYEPALNNLNLIANLVSQIIHH